MLAPAELDSLVANGSHERLSVVVVNSWSALLRCRVTSPTAGEALGGNRARDIIPLRARRPQARSRFQLAGLAVPAVSGSDFSRLTATPMAITTRPLMISQMPVRI